MNALTKLLYKAQFNRAKQKGYITLLVLAAKSQGIRPALVVALASRETGIRNILGDGGHGVGLVQVDIRFHKLAAQMKANGTWETEPDELIHYGVKFLKGLIGWAERKYPGYNFVKIGLSAYNAGQHGAEEGVANGNSDAHTTGGNYAKDIFERADYFETLL